MCGAELPVSQAFTEFYILLQNISTVSGQPHEDTTAAKLEPGGAITPTVSRQLSIMAALARSGVRSRGICAGQSDIGVGFLLVLLFPLPMPIPPTDRHTSPTIIQGWCNRPTSGRRSKWTRDFQPVWREGSADVQRHTGVTRRVRWCAAAHWCDAKGPQMCSGSLEEGQKETRKNWGKKSTR
jgi:hypothetical protein